MCLVELALSFNYISNSSAAGSANAKAAVAGASVDPASEGSDDEQEDADHGAAVSPLDASSLMDRLAIAASP